MAKNDETQVLPPKEEESEEVEFEVILDESPGGEPGGTRTIRVYDKARGDFTLEIPSECTVTFGYFNPAASGMGPTHRTYDQLGPGGNTMKTTCLRVYAGKTSKTPQLAALLGVEGFRDLSLKLTRLRQRVVIESNFEDDGEGLTQHQHKQQRQLTRADEDEVLF
jgi:hypothetical protein